MSTPPTLAHWRSLALALFCLMATGPFHELLHGASAPASGQLEWHRSDCDHLPDTSEEGGCCVAEATRSPWTLQRHAPITGLPQIDQGRLLTLEAIRGYPVAPDRAHIGARAPPAKA
ncbi:MAG: hypothetical protein ACI9EF_002988 [Pseudohongiellaceae bacterium]|jgi:hypothetical protein